MGYNENLAEKLRILLASRSKKDYSEKKMFGGLSFMIGGKMCVGILNDDLVLRVGAERNDEALALPHARPMDFTGKPMKGFVYVGPGGWQKDAILLKCVEMGIDYVSLLPAKKRKKKAQQKK
ncbi:hypothetical protein NTE_00428 [Candidatus Nitrososphaera evergladensis SR1]|uniref:TfoX N-terminal domain-containing protein n=1 Tax=Candidatus Nitrososphaera evergladensis SR1 TaxID=1459636 RepID=A0A075MMX6_9ARCH|nr:TfoX/Sxy family protein [Candidatus Nitrososphaera evergladensis]AIF82510.1 hypothetical protein NTE_00428 [Candidatus Nitrososphaera evergladensis SR1]